jgi:hypothetical protein
VAGIELAKNPADTFFWNDWDNDPALRLCSLAAQGFWMRLLCVAARHDPKGYVAIEGRPLTMTETARCAGCSELEAESLLAELLSKGVTTQDRAGRIYNRRMVRAAKLSRTRSEVGKLGAEITNEKKREKSDLARQNDGKDVGKPPGKQVASSILLSSNKKNIQKKGSPEFDAFWAACPRKVGVGKAREKYTTALEKASHESLLAGMKRYAASVVGKEEQFIAHPATWLHQERWLDELAAQPAVQAQSSMYADLDADDRKWITRLEGFWERKFWLDDWGPKPDQIDHRCPKHLVDRYEQHVRKSRAA